MRRAAALGAYRVGRPLPFEELRFARSNSAGAPGMGDCLGVKVPWRKRWC